MLPTRTERVASASLEPSRETQRLGRISVVKKNDLPGESTKLDDSVEFGVSCRPSTSERRSVRLKADLGVRPPAPLEIGDENGTVRTTNESTKNVSFNDDNDDDDGQSASKSSDKRTGAPPPLPISPDTAINVSRPPRCLRKRGILEVRNTALWKKRLVELEDTMLVIYNCPDGEGDETGDRIALREFFVGSPKESLDLYASISIHCTDSEGNPTVRLNTSKASRTFTVTTKDGALNFRAPDIESKQKWFDAMSSSSIAEPIPVDLSVDRTEVSRIRSGVLSNYAEIALGALNVWRERFVLLKSMTLELYKENVRPKSTTALPLEIVSLQDVVNVRESRLRPFAFALHVRQNDEKKRHCRVLTFAAPTEETRRCWIDDIRYNVREYSQNARRKRVADETNALLEEDPPIARPIVLRDRGSGKQEPKKESDGSVYDVTEDRMTSMLEEVFIPVIGTTTPKVRTPPVPKRRQRRWRQSRSEAVDGWNYRYLTLPRENVQQRQVWISILGLPLPSVKFNIFGKKPTIGTPSNRRNKQVELAHQRIWAYVGVDVMSSRNDKDQRVGFVPLCRTEITSLHSVSVENCVIGTQHEVLDAEFNVAVLLEGDTTCAEIRFTLFLTCESVHKKEVPPLSTFTSFAETQCTMRMIRNHPIEMTLVRAVDKRDYSSTGVYTLGKLLLRPVRPCAHRLRGLCNDAPSYIGTAEQKYHRLPATADAAEAILPTPTAAMSAAASKFRQRQLVDEIAAPSPPASIRHKSGKRPWTIVERLHEPTCVLHVPAAFMSFRAREMRRRHQRLQVWAQALARALGHFSQSASPSAADADARAAGWAVVRLAVVKGRGMRMHFDSSNSFVRVAFEPNPSTRRSSFQIGESNIEFGTSAPEWGTHQYPVPPTFKSCLLRDCRSLSACARLDGSGSSDSDENPKSAWVFYAPPHLKGSRRRTTIASVDSTRRKSGLPRLLDVAMSMAMDIGTRWRLLPSRRRYVSRDAIIEWLLQEKHAVDRAEALDLGHSMLEAGYIHRIDRAGVFRDDECFQRGDDDGHESDDEEGGVYCFGDLLVGVDISPKSATRHGGSVNSRSSPFTPSSVSSHSSPKMSAKSSPISIPKRRLRKHISSTGSNKSGSSPFFGSWYQRRETRSFSRENHGPDVLSSSFGSNSRVSTFETGSASQLGRIVVDVYDVLPQKQGKSVGTPKVSFQKNIIGQLRLPVVPGRRIEGWFPLQGGASSKVRSMTGTYAGEVYVSLVVEPERPSKLHGAVAASLDRTENSAEGRRRRASVMTRRKLRILSEMAARIIDTQCVSALDELVGEDLVKQELVLATFGAAEARTRAEKYEQLAKRYVKLSAKFADVGRTSIGGFKKSVDKSKADLLCLPTNLHVHTVRVLSPKTDGQAGSRDMDRRGASSSSPPSMATKTDGAAEGLWRSATVVTLGAPSAHAMGLKRGLRRKMRRLSKTATPDDGSEDQCSMSFVVRSTESPLLDKTDFGIEERMDAAVSQALAAATASFVAEIERFLHLGRKGRHIVSQIGELGYLCHFESLLSAAKGELSMLEDAEPAIDALSMFSIRLVYVPPGGAGMVSPYSVHAEGGRYVVHVAVDESLYRRLPANVAKKSIKIVPVLFQQGINEVARLNDALGSAGGKEEVRINRTSLRKILTYSTAVRRWEDDHVTAASPVRSARYGSELVGKQHALIDSRVEQINILEKALVDAVCDEKAWTRNVDVLLRSGPLVRALGGGRLTCCKSGKDRTAMSVTLELASVVFSEMANEQSQSQSSVGIFSPTARTDDRDALQELADLLREHGVRLPNCFKNTGKRCYAFNMIQRRMLPPMYRPPLGTYDSLFRKLKT